MNRTQLINAINTVIKPNGTESITGENLNGVLKAIADAAEPVYNDPAETLAGDILKRVDKETGENVNYREVTTWADGTAMTDAKADGIIYVKSGTKYLMREFSGALNVKWFGAKGDMDDNDVGTDDTLAIQKAIDLAYAIYTRENSAADFKFGNGGVYFPAGIYKISTTLIVRHGAYLYSDSEMTATIHCENPMYAFTTILGPDEFTKSYKIHRLTIKQGGIQMWQSVDSEIENVRIFNLSGAFATGLEIKAPVALKITNVKIMGSTGAGIEYWDNLGTGPSTTTFFEKLWVSHCDEGMVINGGVNGGILTSTINNSIFEYNRIGINLIGRTENVKISNIHYEQNDYDAVVSTNATFYADNWWTDGANGIMFVGSASTGMKVTLLNVRGPVNFDGDWQGEITVLGQSDFNFALAPAGTTIKSIT